jgi:hypothetical protein
MMNMLRTKLKKKQTKKEEVKEVVSDSEPEGSIKSKTLEVIVKKQNQTKKKNSVCFRI